MATNILSPRSSGDAAALSGPQSPLHHGASSPAPSPWTEVVDCRPTSPSSADVLERIPSSSPDRLTPANSNDSVVLDNLTNASKKQAWAKPAVGNQNGAVEEVIPVMDAASWPALSAVKALSNGSLPPQSQESEVASPSSEKAVVVNNTSSNSTPNHIKPIRQKLMKLGGSDESSANGGFIQSSMPQPQGPVVEMPPGKPGNPTGVSVLHKVGGQRGGSRNGHQPQRSNSFNRRAGGGQHLRGDGSYHHRRNQDRGNQDWNNPHQSFGSRDAHMEPQRVVPWGFIRDPITSPSFIPPSAGPVRPFGNPMVYPEGPPSFMYLPGPPPDSLRGVPVMAQMPAQPFYYFPVLDPQLYTKIVNQIDYYFSNENIIKDTFLRQNMDDQGWVPIKLIAGFKKVMLLTDNIQLILDAVKGSTVVEVQNDKVRKQNDWQKWIMPFGPFSPVSSPNPSASERSSHDTVEDQFQSVTLDEKTEMFRRPSSGRFKQSGSDDTVQAGVEHNTLEKS